MNPHEACSLLTKLEEFFKGIAPGERGILASVLQPFNYAMSERVITRYAQESSSFDRGKLRTLLIEEHNRRTRRVSETPAWQSTRDAELKERDDLLRRTPQPRLQGAVEEIRKKPVSRFLGNDPLCTDVGKWLIFNELKDGIRN